MQYSADILAGGNAGREKRAMLLDFMPMKGALFNVMLHKILRKYLCHLSCSNVCPIYKTKQFFEIIFFLKLTSVHMWHRCGCPLCQEFSPKHTDHLLQYLHKDQVLRYVNMYITDHVLQYAIIQVLI